MQNFSFTCYVLCTFTTKIIFCPKYVAGLPSKNSEIVSNIQEVLVVLEKTVGTFIHTLMEGKMEKMARHFQYQLDPSQDMDPVKI